MNIRELAYTLYKIDWLRRISADRVMDFVKDYYDDCKEYEDDFDDPSEMASMQEVFEESGFDGEQYVCYDEFIGAEYQDRNYMRELLNDKQYDEYLKDVIPGK